jgi:hypothetical protein
MIVFWASALPGLGLSSALKLNTGISTTFPEYLSFQVSQL